MDSTTRNWLKNQLETLSNHGLVVYSVPIQVKRDENKQVVRDKWDHVKKDFPKKEIGEFSNITRTTLINNSVNASVVFTGRRHGSIIGIDIDDKSTTMEDYIQVLLDNNVDHGLTVSSMNGGLHFYYRVTPEQDAILSSAFTHLEAREKDGYVEGMFGLYIDVKYNNQLMYGAGLIHAEGKQYRYQILTDEPVPDFLFQEIVRRWKGNVPPPTNTLTKEKPKKEKEQKPKVETIYVEEEELNIDSSNVNDLKLKPLLDMMAKHRCDNRESWIKIGSVIYNENGSFQLFDSWSRKSEKYTLEGAKTAWDSYRADRDKKATIKTLHMYAKEDSPEEYEAFIRTHPTLIFDDIYYNMNFGDAECARLFYSQYPDRFLYDIDTKLWYELNEYGIYRQITDELIEARKLMHKLTPVIERDFNERCKKGDDDDYKRMSKFMFKILAFFSSHRNVSNVVSMLKTYYGRNNIYDKMNRVNLNIFAFTNGVYDLKYRKFRKAKPEELVSITCGYEYEKSDELIQNEVLGILQDIFPNEEELSYVLTSIALCLLGERFLEEFYIWVGTGRNGKGVLKEFINVTFGLSQNGYAAGMDMSYLTKSKHGVNANAHDSVMATKIFSRVVFASEMEENTDGKVHLREGKIKEITGLDAINARLLFKLPITFVAYFGLFILTNIFPELNGGDSALMERTRVILFQNHFVDNPTKPHERKINRDLKSNIKEDKRYRIAFFHILLKHLFRFLDNNKSKKLKMPKRFQEDTNSYFQENDKIQQFLDDEYEVTNDPADRIQSSVLYDNFTTFAHVAGMTPFKFKQIMATKGVDCKKIGSMFYLGIRVDEAKKKAKEEQKKNEERCLFD